jgi:NADPH:quinone reductase-like Zn-dependent oxidoreductase
MGGYSSSSRLWQGGGLWSGHEGYEWMGTHDPGSSTVSQSGAEARSRQREREQMPAETCTTFHRSAQYAGCDVGIVLAYRKIEDGKFHHRLEVTALNLVVLTRSLRLAEEVEITRFFMKAMQVNKADQGPRLILAELPTPEPGLGEILVHVHAAGVTLAELVWYPTTHTKSGTARLSAVPGHEFSGVIAAVGKNIEDFEVGDEVYGMNDWFADGATAEFCVTLPQNIARKPSTLSHEATASVPIGALTSWQGLMDRAQLKPGERVLVHGGAGAVGLYAVQLAHNRGAHVISTVSGQDIDFVKRLGADEAIDYKASRFEKEAGDVDVVFDTVGGDTLERSWGVLKPGGRMITIASDSEGTAAQRVKDAFFIVEPNQKQLVEIAKQLDSGHLRAFVKATVPLNDASAAYSGAIRDDGGHGKIVVAVAA